MAAHRPAHHDDLGIDTTHSRHKQGAGFQEGHGAGHCFFHRGRKLADWAMRRAPQPRTLLAPTLSRRNQRYPKIAQGLKADGQTFPWRGPCVSGEIKRWPPCLASAPAAQDVYKRRVARAALYACPRQQVSSLGFRRRRDLACRVHDCVHARPAATPGRPPQPLPSRPGTLHETRILAPAPRCPARPIAPAPEGQLGANRRHGVPHLLAPLTPRHD